MAAFLTGHIRIRNAEKWHQYLAAVDTTIKNHGGEILLRGLQLEVISNESTFNADFERLVVLRFEDMAALRRWYDSADYQRLKTLRATAAEVTVVTYQSDSHYLNESP